MTTMSTFKYRDNKRLHNMPPVFAILLISCTITSAQAGNYYNGKTIYAAYCQSCHGDNGAGSLSGVPNFTRGQSLMKSDAHLFNNIIGGSNAMPAFQGVLKDEDIYDVISYIRNFY